jgi:hypothetical protein
MTKITTYGTLDGQARKGVSGFVPKGLNEGSQAVYCLECADNKARPVGYGLIGNSEAFHDPRLTGRLARPNHTVPPGRAVTLWAYQAINCLVTLIQSLRDDTSATNLRNVSFGRNNLQVS